MANLKPFHSIGLFYLIKEVTHLLIVSHVTRILRLDSSSLILLKEPVHTAVDTLLQSPQGLVAQGTLGLVDVVVAGHAAHDDGLAGEGGCLAKDAGKDLADVSKGDAELAVETPVTLSALIPAGSVPNGASEVPEVNGSVVCDEEGLAVDALMVEGYGGRSRSGEEELCGKEVGMGDIAHVSEIEEVLVGADLDCVLAALVGVHDACEGLDVALTKDTSRTNGGCKELVVV